MKSTTTTTAKSTPAKEEAMPGQSLGADRMAASDAAGQSAAASKDGTGPARLAEEKDIVRWVLTESHNFPTTARFVGALSWRLVDLGVPLWRATIYAATLHPQIHGFGWRWWRDRRVTEEVRIPRGVESTPDYRASPLRDPIERGVAARHRLDGDLTEFPMLGELRAEGGTDYLAAPLNRLRQRYPVVAWATDRPGGFEERHLAVLEEVRPALAAVIETTVVRRTARSLFSIYHGRQIGERILEGQIVRGDVELLRAVIMAVDLRGFTGLSDRLPGEVVIRALDDYFAHVAAAVDAAGGLILKFIGDGVLAIFGADHGREAAAAQAGLSAAREIVRRLETHNATPGKEPHAELRAGIGLHLGDVMYGNIGAPDRLDFTAVGPAVNLAFRLESLTKQLGRPILASRPVAEASRAPLRSLGRHPIRGLSEPEEVFGLPEHDGHAPE